MQMMEAEDAVAREDTFGSAGGGAMASAGDDEDDGMDFFEMLGIKNRNRMDGAFSTHRSRHSSFHMRAPSTYISLVSNQSFIFEAHFFCVGVLTSIITRTECERVPLMEHESVATMNQDFIFCVRCAEMRCETGTRECLGSFLCGRRRMEQQQFFCPECESESHGDG